MEVILEQFVVSLEESGLMAADEVRAFIDGLPSDQKPTSGAELAQSLVPDKGILAFQLHSGPPMKIELKDVFLRHLNQLPKSVEDPR